MSSVRLFRACARVSLVLVVASLAILAVFPASMGELPEGFKTPIIAFELARSPAEIEAMFGLPGSAERAEWVRAMDLGNSVDFGFLLIYGSLLALAGRAFRLTGARSAVIAEVGGVVAALADALENVHLLRITGSLGQVDAATVSALAVFTWLKWGSIAASLAALAPACLRGSRLERVVGGLFVATAITTAVAAVIRGAAAELMALGVVLSFVGLALVVVRRARLRA